MARQTIKTIKVADLRLWSENPRDPIEAKTDYEVIKRAIEDSPKEWNLDRLAREMGDHYDFSEIPTVVYIGKNPIVFDGNRRVAVLKYLQNKDLYSSLSGKLFLDDGPKELRGLKEIPCNVCDKETALTNIERKHSSNGSWGILQREYFLWRHRGAKKSLFLEIEESTKLISEHPKMNQRFVRDEVLTERNLKDIGFSFDDKKGLITNYSAGDAKAILEDIVSAVNNNSITTRNNRGKLKDFLTESRPELQPKIKPFDDKKDTEPVEVAFPLKSRPKRTPPTKPNDVFFGRKLILQKGPINDLYRAIDSIYDQNRSDPIQLETVMPVLGMSLRLILDVAARVYYESQGSTNASQDQLYKSFLKEAKKNMNQQNKNFLSLTSDWLSDQINMDGLLAKYAHGNIMVQKTDVLKTSHIVGDILEEYFKK